MGVKKDLQETQGKEKDTDVKEKEKEERISLKQRLQEKIIIGKPIDNENLTSEEKKKKQRIYKIKSIIYIVLLIILIPISLELSLNSYIEKEIEQVPYTTFQKELEAGEVDIVQYNSSSETMRYVLFNEETKDMSYEDLKNYQYDITEYKQTMYPAGDNFRKELLEQGVRVRIQDFSPKSLSILTILITILGVILPIFFMFFIGIYLFICMKPMLAEGKTEKNTNKSTVKFTDVIGHESIKKDLAYYVDMLKNRDLCTKYKVDVPKGLLMTGSPGTGKTLLAKAIAGEADVPFLYANASSFIEMYVGLGAKRVRDLFKEAREKAPCIVFIDEIDAIGMSRNSNRVGSSENTQTLNALLQELDGYKESKGVLVIGATNNPEQLDSALKRAGRFDRTIQIMPPSTVEERVQLLEYYLKDKKLAEDVNLKKLSQQLTGSTGADISALTNESSIIAMKNRHESITMEDLLEALDKQLLQGNRKKNTNEKIREIVAYHESGHAIVMYKLNKEIARATIVGATSGVGGMVVPAEEETFMSKEQMEEEICICYGGRVSETIKYGEQGVTIGAGNDIEKATKLLQNYVGVCGFEDSYGLLNMNILNNQYVMDDKMIELLKKKAKELEKRTQEILSTNYDLVEKLAQALLEKDTLTGEEINILLTGKDDAYGKEESKKDIES